MKKRTSTKTRSLTDWKRIDAIKDGDIDYSDIPKLGSDFFANAIRWPGPKRQLTLRIDPDVLDFFKKTGKGYQSRINSVLRMQMVRAQATSVPKRKSSSRKKAG
jgi:uncharacterized protein (DUF4415 family)